MTAARCSRGSRSVGSRTGYSVPRIRSVGLSTPTAGALMERHRTPAERCEVSSAPVGRFVVGGRSGCSTQDELERARNRAAAALAESGIVLTANESANIEVADFGLSRLDEIGLQIVVYVNTGARLREGARALSAPDVPGASASAVGGSPWQGGDVPLPQRRRLPLRRGRTRRRVPRAARLRPAPARSPSGTRSSFVPVSNIRSRRTCSTGSRPATREPSSRSSRP